MAGLVKRYAALDVKMNGRFGPLNDNATFSDPP